MELLGGVSGPVPSAEEFSVTTGIEGKWLTFSLSGEWSESSITRVKGISRANYRGAMSEKGRMRGKKRVCVWME